MQPEPNATERRYRGLLESQRASGQSLKAFAQSVGVNPSTLSWWKYEIRRRDERRACAAADPAPLFLPVRLRSGPVDTSVTPRVPFELVLDRGVRLRIFAGFENSELQRVFDCLGLARC